MKTAAVKLIFGGKFFTPEVSHLIDWKAGGFHEVQFIVRVIRIYQNFFRFIYLYIYPSDSQKSDGDAINTASSYPDLLPEMSRYGWQIERFYFGFSVL